MNRELDWTEIQIAGRLIEIETDLRYPPTMAGNLRFSEPEIGATDRKGGIELETSFPPNTQGTQMPRESRAGGLAERSRARSRQPSSQPANYLEMMMGSMRPGITKMERSRADRTKRRRSGDDREQNFLDVDSNAYNQVVVPSHRPVTVSVSEDDIEVIPSSVPEMVDLEANSSAMDTFIISESKLRPSDQSETYHQDQDNANHDNYERNSTDKNDKISYSIEYSSAILRSQPALGSSDPSLCTSSTKNPNWTDRPNYKRFRRSKYFHSDSPLLSTQSMQKNKKSVLLVEHKIEDYGLGDVYWADTFESGSVKQIRTTRSDESNFQYENLVSSEFQDREDSLRFQMPVGSDRDHIALGMPDVIERKDQAEQTENGANTSLQPRTNKSKGLGNQRQHSKSLQATILAELSSGGSDDDNDDGLRFRL
ncbi:uncharacterized protein V1516DRAFT_677058 [Lipomyces oligophaga]|uniref:uncharacterized protein n=1 Tax=Lipomyces oligophaga TaxID=45792 RepID=UPI0034CEEE8D